MKLFLLISLFFSFINNGFSEPKNIQFYKQGSELEKIQQQTVLTHKELLKINLIIKNIKLDIKKNKQSQVILKKYIKDEEDVAQGIIILLQDKYHSSEIKNFLKEFSSDRDQNYITNKYITKNVLELIKEDINLFLENLSQVKKLDDELNMKISKLNIQKKNLKQKKKKLEQDVKKRIILQKKNPDTLVFNKKKKKIIKKVKNINELVDGVSSLKVDDIKNRSNGVIFPVKGNIISRFGETKKPFPSKDGLIFEYENDPYIVSPIDGIVIFAEKFRGYGNLIIIKNNKNRYHTILSGMDEITVISGSKVLMGEPIAKNYFIENNKKKLYFELRYRGKPIDPKREVEIL